MQNNRVFGLDLLRAIAISLVVLSHCTFILCEDTDNPILLAIRSLGAIGVDLFFVLSGYLIGGIILKQINSGKTKFNDFLRFWKRRWFRTLPNYFLVLLINILIVVLTNENLPGKILLYIPFLQNFSSQHPDFFTEAWSLSIEEYSYLILPLVLFLALYFLKNINSKQKVFIWVTITLIVVQFFFKIGYYVQTSIESLGEWSSTFRKVVVYRLDMIYYGFVLIYFFTKNPYFFNRYKKILLLISIFIFSIVHVLIFIYQIMPQSHLAFYVFAYLPLIAICCALIFPIATNLNTVSRFQKGIYFLSTRSYAIYLINYSIVLLNLKNLFNLGMMSLFMKFGTIVLFLSVTILLSDLLYRYFEKPILNYRDSKY